MIRDEKSYIESIARHDRTRAQWNLWTQYRKVAIAQLAQARADYERGRTEKFPNTWLMKDATQRRRQATYRLQELDSMDGGSI